MSKSKKNKRIGFSKSARALRVACDRYMAEGWNPDEWDLGCWGARWSFTDYVNESIRQEIKDVSVMTGEIIALQFDGGLAFPFNFGTEKKARQKFACKCI